MDRHGKWMGSVSHDSVLKMTDLEGALEDSDEDKSEGVDSEGEETAPEEGQRIDDDRPMLRRTRREDEDDDAEDESDAPTEPRSKKRKRKARQKAKNKDGCGIDPGFFSAL
jgi:hypothetical protein